MGPGEPVLTVPCTLGAGLACLGGLVGARVGGRDCGPGKEVSSLMWTHERGSDTDLRMCEASVSVSGLGVRDLAREPHPHS